MSALFLKVNNSDHVGSATFRPRKIYNPFADPQYSTDHGPLPHIAAGDVIQQKYSINSSTIKNVT